MANPTFYSNRPLLPQAQTADQLSAWLSSRNPGYDLVAWCLYGNLRSGSNADPVTAALASIVQYINTPDNPLPLVRGLRSFETGLCFCNKETNGYLLSGDLTNAEDRTLTVTQTPWSAVNTYGVSSILGPSIAAFSLTGGQIGQAGATYRITADAVASNLGRLKVDIELCDQLGAVAIGSGPMAFAPQYVDAGQQALIDDLFDGRIDRYLKESGDAMADQGTFYYALPLLNVSRYEVIVEKFDIGLDGNPLKIGEQIYRGAGGTLWCDIVVQSFTEETYANLKDASWQYFAIQFPEQNLALMIYQVTTQVTEDGGGTSSSVVTLARLFALDGPRHPNGALSTVREWAKRHIQITPDPNGATFSPANSGVTFYLDYTLTLITPMQKPSGSDPLIDVSVELTPMHTNQSIAVGQDVKYEGAFWATGTVLGQRCSGTAWAELHQQG